MTRLLGFSVMPFLGFGVVLTACTTQEWYERKPEPPARCVVVTDGRHAACLSPVEFLRWRQRNGL